jgi:AraC-like DNA-binding protein
LAFWEDPVALTYGPLIYFFSLHIKNRSLNWKPAFILHFLPFLLMEVLVIVFHISYSREEVQEIITTLVSQNLEPIAILGMAPVFLHLFTYILLAQQSLNKHRTNLKQNYSTLEISWAFSLVRMVLLIFLISLLSTIAQYLGTPRTYTILLLAIILISIFLTLRILLYALNRPIFHAVVKPGSSFDLTRQENERISEQIKLVLGGEKLYKDPNLTLKDLALALDTAERTVSYVINDSMADNFYDLVNDYRINEAKQILQNSKDHKQTVLEVLYEVGFNSKSSFNTQFKKKTGMTPSEFKRLQQT